MEMEKFKTRYYRWENNIKADFEHKQCMRLPSIPQKIWGNFEHVKNFLFFNFKMEIIT
jgi:hypothetical protein